MRPGLIARKAHLAAAKLEKPLLNIGHGFQTTSLRTLLGASPLWGDLNVDLDPQAQEAPQYLRGSTDRDGIPIEDNSIGAVLLLHSLERVEDPVALIREAERVLTPGGEMFAVTSPWWAPHAWFKRQWLMVDLPDGQKRAVRLWKRAARALPESGSERVLDPQEGPAMEDDTAAHFGGGNT